MVLLNYAAKEVNAKVVYYGPGLSGKTTNLQYIHDNVPIERRGKMVSLATEKDRTLFFDLLPLDLGNIRGFNTRIQLYTVPGQVHYNSTRKLVLTGVDAVVFVADSALDRMEANIDSLENLKENLSDHGLSLNQIPWVIQYNKRDLANITTLDDLNASLNPMKVPYFQAVATEGQNVFETLKAISKLVLRHLSENPSFKGTQAPGATGKKEGPGAGASWGTEESGIGESVASTFHKMEMAMQKKKLTQYSLSEFAEDYFPNMQNSASVFLEIPLTGSSYYHPTTDLDAEAIAIQTETRTCDLVSEQPQSSTLMQQIETEPADIPDIDDIHLPLHSNMAKRAPQEEMPASVHPDDEEEELPLAPPAVAMNDEVASPEAPLSGALSETSHEHDEHVPDFLQSFVKPTEDQEPVHAIRKYSAASEFLICLEKFELKSSKILQASSTLQTIGIGLRLSDEPILDLMEDILNLKEKRKLDHLDQAVSEGVMRLTKYNLSWQDLLHVANVVQTFAIDRKITERLDRFQVRYDPEGGQIFYVRSDEDKYF